MSELSSERISPRMKYMDDIAMVWMDLSFTGTALLGIKSNLILNNINGYLKFGSLNALMGPSGSGKSTFLKCINGHNSGGLSTDTEIYVNKTKTIRPCFIVQDVSDHLLNGLTGKQSLIYASKLKNSEENFKVDHQNNVNKLMDDLMISDTANTLIGRCSGGEQKRLAIAAELTAIKMPNLLCIDEPTSGLDSNAAEIVIQSLKMIALKHHIAVVTSIHQPNSELLMMCDKLYVLSKGGKCVFFGSPHDLSGHLKLSNVECKSFQVPIEVLIKYASKGLKNEDVVELVTRNYDSNKFYLNKYKSECKISLTGIQRKHKSFSFFNFVHLFNRSLINTVKWQWIALIIQAVVSSNVSLVVALMGNENIGKIDGCVNLEQDYRRNDTAIVVCAKGMEALRIENMINQNLIFVFVLCGLIQFLQLVSTALTFSSEIKVFFNEHRNGWYSTSSYYWAKSLVDLPLPAIITFVYILLGYRTSNQIDVWFRFYGFNYFTIIAVLCCQGIGFLMCIIFDNSSQLAITASILWFIVIVFFCDFLAPVLELNEVLQFISNISFLKQTFHSCLIYVYGFDRCDSGTVSWALQQFELNVDESFKLYLNYGLITSHFVIMRVIAMLVLMRKANPKQKRMADIQVDEQLIEIKSELSGDDISRY